MVNDNFNEANILNRSESLSQGRFLSQQNIGKDSFYSFQWLTSIRDTSDWQARREGVRRVGAHPPPTNSGAPLFCWPTM